jgi:hypothetical protein
MPENVSPMGLSVLLYSCMEECNTMRTALYKIKEFIKRKKREEELMSMDMAWYLTDQSSWSLFPPSFYATHTEEEINKAAEEQLALIEAIIDRLGDSNSENEK